jgi:MOSC domain-containing protein YiiM
MRDSETRERVAMTGQNGPKVVAVSRSAKHDFTKPNQLGIRLVAGLGVEGDAHLGETVQHLYLIKKNAAAPNLRQVHLMHAELFDELAPQGFSVAPGDLGENVTTRGLDILGLPTGTRLHLGDTAVIEVTGLRNPCHQIDKFQKGLLKATLGTDAQGKPLRKSGIMSIVLAGGDVRPGDTIGVELPATPFRPLEVV